MKVSLPMVANCDDCGVCCLEQAFLPVSYWLGMVSAAEAVATLPEGLIADLCRIKEAEMDKGKDGFKPGPCIWFDHVTKKCRNYIYRPDTCRLVLEPGDETCHRWRRKYGIEPNVKRRLVNGNIVRTP